MNKKIIIALLCLYYITSGHCEINIFGYSDPFPIYQWSTVSLQNGTEIYLTLDLNSINVSVLDEGDVCCLIIPHQSDFIATRNLINENYKDNDKVQCIIVQIDSDDSSPLQLWCHNPKQFLSTKFPIGLLFTNQIYVDNITLFESSIVNATFDDWDDNPYFPYFWSEVLVYGFMAAFNLIVVIVGIYRIYERYKTKQLEVNIATVCIILETFSSAFRVIQLVMKVSENALPAVTFQHNIVLFFIYISYPCTLSSGVFLIFFWIDITLFSKYKGGFMDKLFWPCIVLVTIICVITDVSAILFLVNIDEMTVMFMNIIILVISFIVSIIYFVCAYKLYRYMKDTQTENRERMHRFVKLIYRILASGVITILIVIVNFSTIGSDDVGTGIIVKYFGEIFLFSRSLIMIEIFKTPKISNTNPSESEMKEKTSTSNSSSVTGTIENTPSNFSALSG